MSNEVANCPLCGSSIPDSFPYLAKMSTTGKLLGKMPSIVGSLMPSKNFQNRFKHGKKVIKVFESKRWYRCQDCNFGFAEPKFSMAELGEYYGTDFWNVRNSLDLEAVIYDKDNLCRPMAQLAFMKRNGLERTKSMLDFGAGMCGAAALFQKEDFCKDISILDPSSQAKKIAQFLAISQLERFEDAGDKLWELIYSSHSLEHVTNVKEVLDWFHKLLLPGGHLFIEVPNVENLTVLTEFHHAPHTYCFSKKSLVKAAAGSGFELVEAIEYGDFFQQRIEVKHRDLQVHESLMALFIRKD